MAAKLMRAWEKVKGTLWGTLLIAAVYAVMLLLVLMFFTGNGQFLYEI